MKATSRLPYQVYKDLPAGFKKWMKECGNDKDKSSDGKTSAHDRLANHAETVVPSTISVTTEAAGIMGAVSGGKSTASDIRHVLSATLGAATGSRGEYCVAGDGKVYVSMNALRIGRHFYENVMCLIQKSVWYTQNPTCPPKIPCYHV